MKKLVPVLSLSGYNMSSHHNHSDEKIKAVISSPHAARRPRQPAHPGPARLVAEVSPRRASALPVPIHPRCIHCCRLKETSSRVEELPAACEKHTAIVSLMSYRFGVTMRRIYLLYKLFYFLQSKATSPRLISGSSGNF